MKLPTTGKLSIGTVYNFPKIFRAGKKDKVIYWQAQVTNDAWRAVSGFVDGKEKVGAWSSCEPMNVGKANARNATEQALFTAKAKMEKLLKRGGYFLKVEDIGKVQFVAPMLAHGYDADNPPQMPVYVQPKLNGNRCVDYVDGMFTRNGEPYHSAPHIHEALKRIFVKHPDLVIDGELYNHSHAELLNRLNSLVRVKRPTPQELKESEEIVQFHVYDMFSKSGKHTAPFEARMIELKLLLAGKQFCHIVPTHFCTTVKQIDDWFAYYVQRGYEGLMIRNPKGVYVNDRTTDLLKYKPRYSDDFQILEIVEGNGKRKGKAGSIIVAVPAGKYEGPGEKGYVVTKATTARINVRWSDTIKAEIWRDREELVGTLLTVSYAYITEFGKPFHNYSERLWRSKTRI